jgi:hypothetical protein
MKRKKEKIKKDPETGKILTVRFGFAIRHKFYLEAIMILSQLFERKLGKIMGKVEPQYPDKVLPLAQSIILIKSMHSSEKYLLLKDNVEKDLIERIRRWKTKRNLVYKKLMEIKIPEVRFELLANEGIQLYRELNKSAKSLKLGRESTKGEA